MNYYDIGDVVELTGWFTDPTSGDPVDPAEVTCTVQPPGDAAALTPKVTKAGSGIYTARVSPDVDGKWDYAFDGTEGHEAAGERAFKVRERAAPPTS